MSAVDALINLVVDQNRRGNISGIADGLNDGSIQPNQALIKLGQATGDPNDLMMGIKQGSINNAQGLNFDGTPKQEQGPMPDGSAGYPASPALQSLPQFQQAIGQNTGDPAQYASGRNAQAVSGAMAGMPAGTDPIQAMVAGGMAAFKNSGDPTYLKGVMETVMKAQQAGSEINKNNAQAGEARAATSKANWEMGAPGAATTPANGMGAAAIPTGGMPQVNASDLSGTPAGTGSGTAIPPPPDGIALSGNNPAQPTATPAAIPGQPVLGGQAAQQAALEAAKAKQAEVLAAQKGVQQILSRLPSMKAKLQQMNSLAPKTISGMGVQPPPDSNETYGLKGQLMEQFPQSFDPDDKIGATSAFKSLNDQLFVNEIPALMNGASGMRMDIPLVKGVKSASGVPLDLPPKDKQQVITTLNDNFDQTRDNALSYYKNLTGQDYDMGSAFQTPAQIRQAVTTGVINTDQAKKILRDHFGAVQKGQ